MPEINFYYGNKKQTLKISGKNKLIFDILKDYSLTFLYKGKNMLLNKEKKLGEINKQKRTSLKIIVLNLNKKYKNDNKELKNIICPECKNLSIINFNDEDKISLNCVKKDNIQDLSINEFIRSQYYEESDIKCDDCKNKRNLYNNFYICSCNKKVCPLCFGDHFGKHTIIEYDKKFSNCDKHRERIVSYCQSCNKNLCQICEIDHIKHKTTNIKQKKPNEKKINELKNEIGEIETKIKKLKWKYKL